MVCEDWRTKLDTHLDGELPEQEMFLVDTHVRSSPSCSADTLMRVQLKRAIHATGRRFVPSAKFRERIEQSIASRPQHSLRSGWIFAAATVAMITVGALTSAFMGARSGWDHVLSEIADLHVVALASSSPVDVISTDRHTVKPWFQGKIPFAFGLPDLRNLGNTSIHALSWVVICAAKDLNLQFPTDLISRRSVPAPLIRRPTILP